LFDKINET